MTTTFEAANAELRKAVADRVAAVASGTPSERWYDPQDEDSPTMMEVLERNVELLADPRFDDEVRLVGDGVLGERVHPSSQAFFDLCDELKEIHRTKSIGYGSPDDPLANIRNGAKFVGIEPCRAAMLRLSDKVTRLETYCRTGSLTFEGVEDTLVDLASYALLTLLTHREANREP